MSEGIESLLNRISRLVLLRWNVSLSFLSDMEANDRYKFPFESTPSTAPLINMREPQGISVIPIYQHNLLMGAMQIPSDAITHDDILEISELTETMISQSLLLQEELQGTERALNQLAIEKEKVFNYGPLITRNKDLYKTWQALDEHLDSMAPILICGERGVGKKTLARIFAEKNRIKDIEIIILPVSDALSAKKQEEIASILFHQKLNPAEGPRIIAIADFDYPTLAKQGWLKPALLKRLNQIVITLAPLRKRREDLVLLMEHRFEMSSDRRLSIKDCTSQTISALCEYDWPGNIQELFDVIDGFIENYDETRISADLLPPSIIGRGKIEALKKAKETRSLPEAITVLEKELIRESLQTANWNKSLVSKQLGISRSNLIRKVEKYHLTP
ncbi:MAG: hypothetical protein A3F16_03700 [Deltaproteobacteria bacterium RIFCSPHIGHO2_12_FULL_43_9]|nr:MAG: hypothetical protein A3F16_03700 [Deltaproteobacteria bacterium RIFCSPHIGHO2_12_FULL_43_9]